MKALYVWIIAGIIVIATVIIVTVNIVSKTPEKNTKSVMPTTAQLKSDTNRDNKLNAEAWSDNESGKPPPAPNPFPQQNQSNKP